MAVYADAAYFDRHIFRLFHDILDDYPATDYNLRKTTAKRKIATLYLLLHWKRLVTRPCLDIKRHFAWMNRYFDL